MSRVLAALRIVTQAPVVARAALRIAVVATGAVFATAQQADVDAEALARRAAALATLPPPAFDVRTAVLRAAGPATTSGFADAVATAAVLAAHAGRHAEFAALLDAARSRRADAAATPLLLAALRDLTRFALRAHATRSAPPAAAATLADAFARLHACTPPQSWSPADHRLWAECCLLADDLTQLAEVVAQGLEATRANDFQHAAMQLVAVRLACRLGRIEDAAAAAAAADAATRRYVAGLEPRHRAGAQGLRCAVARALADVYLLTDDLAAAEAAIAEVADDPSVAFHRHLLPVLRGDRAHEGPLLRAAGAEGFDPALRRLALGKVAQMALLRGDLAAARRAHDALADVDDDLGAALALELALRGGAPLADELPRARRVWHRALRRWAAAPRPPGGTGPLSIGDRATLAANVLRAEAAADGPRAALQQLLALHAATTADAAAAPGVDAALRELLGRDHGLLVFVPGRFGTIVLAADHATVTAHELPPARALRDAADALRRAAHTALAASDRELPGALEQIDAAAAAAASAVLPNGLRRRLENWQRVTVCGAGMLQNLPFERLPLPAGPGAAAGRFGERLAVDYVSNLARAAAAPPRRAAGGPVVFAASLLATTAHARPARMPPRARRVTDAWRDRGAVATDLLDGDCTVAAVRAALREASVVHVVGHGDQDARSTFEHAVRFADAPGTTLTGDLVAGDDLRGVVVILGSCRAGEAPLRRGGEPLAASLAGAMLAAGARCVVTAEVDLHVDAHLRAATHLHRALAEGLPPAEALRAARLAADVRDDPRVALETALLQVHGRGF